MGTGKLQAEEESQELSEHPGKSVIQLGPRFQSNQGPFASSHPLSLSPLPRFLLLCLYNNSKMAQNIKRFRKAQKRVVNIQYAHTSKILLNAHFFVNPKFKFYINLKPNPCHANW